MTADRDAVPGALPEHESQHGMLPPLPESAYPPGATPLLPLFVHVIPVDPSLTADEAWHEIRLFGKRITFTGPETWVAATCDGDCGGIETDGAP